MANEENLKPLDTRTKSEQREIQRKAGIASGMARRRKKAFREYMEEQLNSNGGTLNGEKATKKEIIAARAVQICMENGVNTNEFLKAFEIIRDTIGEKPTDKVDVTANAEAKNSLEKMAELIND